MSRQLEWNGSGAPGTDQAAGLLAVELAEQTRAELLVLTPTPVELDRALSPDLVAGLLRRRLRVRILYAVAAGPCPAAFAQLVDGGVAYETSVRLPAVVLVRDRAVVYAQRRGPVPAVSPHRTVRLTRLCDAVLAGSLAVAFEAIWSSAARRDGPAGLSEGDRQILRALGDGLTDDQAALRLHVSKRTLSRRMATVMDRLGAGSRFQAGVRAAQRGWL